MKNTFLFIIIVTATVKAEVTNIRFDKYPVKENYKCVLINDIKLYEYDIKSILFNELSKYPDNVIKTYISNEVIVVDSIYYKGNYILGFINTEDNNSIVLSKEVFYSYQYKIHHEIFHLLTNNAKIISAFNDKFNALSAYPTQYYVTELSVYISGFATGYHPSPIEDACEIFALLMKKQNDGRELTLLEWKNTQNANSVLRQKIDFVIQFTKIIIDEQLNENFYKKSINYF